MPLAYAQSLGDGATRVFSVPFPYISKTHVQVRVEGVIVPYTWLSETSIQLVLAPAVNAVVDRRRVTPRDTLLVDFVDGSTLVESDLDLSALQVFYLAQEAFDLGEASLGVTEDGSFSALNRRISNVLNPVNPQDVATKNFVETGVTSQVCFGVEY
ncbi:phage tail fiber protein [Agrobacterium sp. 16-172Ci]